MDSKGFINRFYTVTAPYSGSSVWAQLGSHAPLGPILCALTVTENLRIICFSFFHKRTGVGFFRCCFSLALSFSDVGSNLRKLG